MEIIVCKYVYLHIIYLDDTFVRLYDRKYIRHFRQAIWAIYRV